MGAVGKAAATGKAQDKKSSEYARLALPLMAQHGIEPTPDNYATWFTYVSGENTKLREDIDTFIRDNRPFTDDTNEYLYSRHIAQDLDKKMVEKATTEAQALLMQIMQAIETVGGNTNAYSKELDEYNNTLEGSRITSDSLKETVANIIQRTQAMSEEGKKLSSKLAKSTREIDELRDDLRRVSKETEEDFLTGLHNRKAFDNRLEAHVVLAKEHEGPLSLIMLDIDHFKKFNDKFGHQVGDEVLRQVARILTDCVRGKDIAARYGGEEFALILPDTPLNGGLIVAENIRRLVAAKSFRLKKSGDKLDNITVSLGVSSFRHTSDNGDQLLERADTALYRSKSGGRNKVTQENM